MKGITKITLNEATIKAAIQDYFTKRVFDASQVAEVTDVEPVQEDDGYWEYVVTVNSDIKVDPAGAKKASV